MSGPLSSKSSLARIGIQKQVKTLRVMVLGQSAVGKSAMVVRFLTRRFIGEYDSSERFYTFSTSIDNEIVNFEILDSAGQLENETSTTALELNIRWAEAFIVIYSVTDKCSFEEVNRLKFLINYNKRRRRNCKEDFMDFPVILVANKIDQCDDRMVSAEEGLRRSQEIGCACFHEISVRENSDEVQRVFQDICRSWKILSRFPKLKRSKSDSIRLSMTLHSDVDKDKVVSKLHHLCFDVQQDEKRRSIMFFGRSRSTWNEDEQETDEFDIDSNTSFIEPFRSRAKTDGNLLISRTRRWMSPIVSPPVLDDVPVYLVINRRNSISMRGHVSY